MVVETDSVRTQLYDIRVHDDLCNPCQGHRGNTGPNRFLSSPDQCPVLLNDTHVIESQLRPMLSELRYDMNTEIDKLSRTIGADETFKPWHIPDLENIDNSNISKHLKAGSKPEEIIQYSYGRITLLLAYLDLTTDIFHEQLPEHKHDMPEIVLKLKRLACKLYDYTKRLGVRKIRKKVCNYGKQIALHGAGDKRSYVLTILQLGKVNMLDVSSDIEHLHVLSTTGKCKYNCLGRSRRIECEESDDKRLLRSGRRRKSLRKKTGKGRKGRRNRGKMCSKTLVKDTDKNKNKKRCRNRRNKNKNRRKSNKNKKLNTRN